MKKIIALLFVAILSVAAIFAIDEKALIGNWIYTDNSKDGWRFEIVKIYDDWECLEVYKITGNQYADIDICFRHDNLPGNDDGDERFYSLSLNGDTLTITMEDPRGGRYDNPNPCLTNHGH